MVLFWELKFFDLMIRHHAGVMSENHKRGWNIANSHNCLGVISHVLNPPEWLDNETEMDIEMVNK